MGAFNPSPEKSGAERGHIEEVLLESALDDSGTALATDKDTFAWAERFAESRALAYLWHANRRFGNQWDPDRMTDFLPRWEKMLGLRPRASDTEVTRRARVRARLELDGEPGTQQVVFDLMTVVLGELFVSVVATTSAEATGFVPGGATVPGGVTLGDSDWYSTIAHVAIETVHPAAMSDADFYAALAQIGQYLDPLLPAWVTWDWFVDGVNGAGFYLDEDKNLDNQRFD